MIEIIYKNKLIYNYNFWLYCMVFELILNYCILLVIFYVFMFLFIYIFIYCYYINFLYRVLLFLIYLITIYFYYVYFKYVLKNTDFYFR